VRKVRRSDEFESDRAVLYLAPGTVRKHLDNVYAKLDVGNRAGAVARAFLN
jgi:DNA-binding CsgD family transcriptional regulator